MNTITQEYNRCNRSKEKEYITQTEQSQEGLFWWLGWSTLAQEDESGFLLLLLFVCYKVTANAFTERQQYDVSSIQLEQNLVITLTKTTDVYFNGLIVHICSSIFFISTHRNSFEMCKIFFKSLTIPPYKNNWYYSFCVFLFTVFSVELHFFY